MNDITFSILKITVSVVAALLSYYLIPLIKAKIEAIKSTELRKTVKEAVRAAEQTLHAPGQGVAKKADVVAFVSEWLTEHGIKITEDQLDKLIEAAVFSMNNKEGDDE